MIVEEEEEEDYEHEDSSTDSSYKSKAKDEYIQHQQEQFNTFKRARKRSYEYRFNREKRNRRQSATAAIFTRNKSCYSKIDCNFLVQFVVTQVNPFIYFGGCPEIESDYEQLRDNGINIVLNTLTPIDFLSYNLSWTQIEGKHAEFGIVAKNSPLAAEKLSQSVF